MRPKNTRNPKKATPAKKTKISKAVPASQKKPPPVQEGELTSPPKKERAPVFAPSPEIMRSLSSSAESKPAASASDPQQNIASLLGIHVNKKVRSGFGGLNKDSEMKICKCPGAILFRLEPVDKSGRVSSWSEKVFFEALRNDEEWIAAAGIDSQCLHWCHRNIRMLNKMGYPIHLFVVYLEEDAPMPGDLVLIKLGTHLCTRINQAPGNETNASISINPFWPSNEVAVWSDVIGVDAACKKLVNECGSFVPGFYEQHKKKVHTCFREGELSMTLARMIHAPIEQVAEEERPDYDCDNCMNSAVDTERSMEGDDNQEETHDQEETQDATMEDSADLDDTDNGSGQ